MTLVNSRPGLMLITDVRVGGVSVFATIRADLLRSGQLEDPDDVFTLLPGESLSVDVAEGAHGEFVWIEKPPDVSA